jgi:hypothetical protein
MLCLGDGNIDPETSAKFPFPSFSLEKKKVKLINSWQFGQRALAKAARALSSNFTFCTEKAAVIPQYGHGAVTTFGTATPLEILVPRNLLWSSWKLL